MITVIEVDTARQVIQSLADVFLRRKAPITKPHVFCFTQPSIGLYLHDLRLTEVDWERYVRPKTHWTRNPDRVTLYTHQLRLMPRGIFDLQHLCLAMRDAGAKHGVLYVDSVWSERDYMPRLWRALGTPEPLIQAAMGYTHEDGKPMKRSGLIDDLPFKKVG